MDKTEFEAYEDELHTRFDNIELLARPSATLLSITLLKFRNVSVSFLHDLGLEEIYLLTTIAVLLIILSVQLWLLYKQPCFLFNFGLLQQIGIIEKVDTPDPQFRVTCPKVVHESVRTFVTRNIGDDVTSGEINETFQFVVPSTIRQDEDFPLIIELSDADHLWNNIIGRETFDAATLDIDGEPLYKTFVFGKKQGELDVMVHKIHRSSLDFRYSLSLCSEERVFRKKRIPIVQEAIKKAIGQEKGPKTLLETPVVSLVCSGGGYRAVTGMCGAMEALKDAGLLDIITYSCGLSGSAWYLSTAYALKGVKAEEQESFQNGIRARFKKNLLWNMVNPFTINEYSKYKDRSYDRYGLPHTFVNYFPGFLVGEQMLDKKMELKLSEMTPYIEDAEVPFPLFIALHVKDKCSASNFHAYTERSPYEIYLPSYGIGLDPKNEGSSWSEGFVVRKRPEYPLHFTIGMTGCAFSIMLNSFFKNGGEIGGQLLNFIESERLEGKKLAGKDLDETGRAAEIESEENDEELEDEEEEIIKPKPRIVLRTDSAIGAAAMSRFATVAAPATPSSKGPKQLLKALRKIPLLTSRNSLIDRTARTYNFLLGMQRVKRHPLNPFGVAKPKKAAAKELIDTLGVASVQKKISTKSTALCFADAGVLKNVPTDAVLRPQRTTEIMIVMDFNDYGSDDYFDYKPLLASAAHAWQSGLKFPNIDFETITNLPPQEFLAFPSDNEGCPTVLWFTLSNKKFRKEENYFPKSKEKAPDDKKFNDFDVFGDNSFCSSFTFQYDNYRFDQLRELMYFNVKKHIEEIKEALIQATERKRERFSKEL